MATWMIEGLWSGPVSPAGEWNRMQHREYTRSKRRAEACEKLGRIRFSDGTCLRLLVTPHTGGKRLPTRNGYGELIDRCVAAGKDVNAEAIQ